jgi:hypothetical protein
MMVVLFGPDGKKGGIRFKITNLFKPDRNRIHVTAQSLTETLTQRLLFFTGSPISYFFIYVKCWPKIFVLNVFEKKNDQRQSQFEH